MKRMILGGLILGILLYSFLSLEPGLNETVDNFTPDYIYQSQWGEAESRALGIVGGMFFGGIGLIAWGYRDHKKTKRLSRRKKR